MDALWAGGVKHSWSWQLKVNVEFSRHFQKGGEAGLKLPLAFVSSMEKHSSGRKEGVDGSSRSPEIISEVNAQWLMLHDG